MARKFSEKGVNSYEFFIQFASRYKETLVAKYIEIFNLFSDCNPIEGYVDGYTFCFYLKTEKNEPFCLEDLSPDMFDEGLNCEGYWTIHAETEEAAKRAKSEIEEALMQKRNK